MNLLFQQKKASSQAVKVAQHPVPTTVLFVGQMARRTPVNVRSEKLNVKAKQI